MVPAEFNAMLAHDDQHWWYRGRRRVLRATLDRLPIPPAARILDAGCGSGRTLDDLQRYGTVSGVDALPAAVERAHDRGHHDVRVGLVEHLDFASETFDVVTCMDVIEHTPEDDASMRELRRVTRPGGVIVLTVPAHPLLWSTHDVVNAHYRRYTRRTLAALAAKADLLMVSDTYFNSLILAPAAAVRWQQRLLPTARRPSDLERTSRAWNRWLEVPVAAEARLIARGTRIPAGLSLLCVLRRPSPFVSQMSPTPPDAWRLPALAGRGAR